MKNETTTTNLSNVELTVKEYFQCEKKHDILRSVIAVQNAEIALFSACIRAMAILDGGKR